MKEKISTLALLLTFSHLLIAQDQLVNIDCKGDDYQVKYYNTPLTPGLAPLRIEVEALSGNVSTFRYINTTLPNDIQSTDDSKKFTFFRELSASRFKSTDEFTLILEPILSESEAETEQLIQCNQLIIPIPIKVNTPPTKVIENGYEVPLLVGSTSRNITIQVKDLIKDDDYKGGKWIKSTDRPEFDVNGETGEVTFIHPGNPSQSTERFNTEVIYFDWEGLSATIDITVNVTKARQKAKLNSINYSTDNQYLFYEDIEGKIGKITALDDINNEIDAQIIGIRQADGSINNGENYGAIINDSDQLEWTPNSGIVTDNNTRVVVFAIQSKPTTGVLQSDIAFVTVKVKNRTSPDSRKNIEEASKLYNEANSLYSKIIKRPTCVMAHVLTHLSINEMNIGAFEGSYEKINDLSLNIPAQVTGFINIGFEVAKTINTNKKEKFESIVKSWNTKNSELLTVSNDLIKKLNSTQLNDYKTNFTSDQEATALLENARSYKNLVSGLPTYELTATTGLISGFGAGKKRNKILTVSCPPN